MGDEWNTGEDKKVHKLNTVCFLLSDGWDKRMDGKSQTA